MDNNYKIHLRVLADSSHNMDIIRIVDIYSNYIEEALAEVFNQVDLENSYEVKEFRATMGRCPGESQLLDLMENSDDDWDYIIQIKEMNSGRILYESGNPMVLSKVVEV